MTEAAKETDTQKRQELLLAAEKILVSDETVICPLFTTDSLYLINPDITGVKEFSTGGFDFRFASKSSGE
jgi:ABC-type oligopeptide transport system substrate-binding subunit